VFPLKRTENLARKNPQLGICKESGVAFCGFEGRGGTQRVPFRTGRCARGLANFSCRRRELWRLCFGISSCNFSEVKGIRHKAKARSPRLNAVLATWCSHDVGCTALRT
jgi:hypothetical protein